MDRIELVLKFDTVSMRIEGTESSSIRYIRYDTYRTSHIEAIPLTLIRIETVSNSSMSPIRSTYVRVTHRYVRYFQVLIINYT